MEREPDDDTHCCCGCCPSLRAGVIALAVLTLLGSFGHLFVASMFIRCDKQYNILTGDQDYPSICFKIDNWFGVSSLIQGFLAIAVSAMLLIGIFQHLVDLLLPYIFAMIVIGVSYLVVGGLLTFMHGSHYRMYGSFQMQWGVLVIYFCWLVRRFRREMIYKQGHVLTVSTSQTGSELSAELQNGRYSRFDHPREPLAIHPLDNYPLPSISTNHQRISSRSASHPAQQGIFSTPRRNSQPGNYLKPTAIPRLVVYPQPNPNQQPAIYRPSNYLRPGYMQSASTLRPSDQTTSQPTNPIQSVTSFQLDNPVQPGSHSQFGYNLQSGANWHPGISKNPDIKIQQADVLPPLSSNVQLDMSPDNNPQSGSLTPPDDNP